MIRTPLEALLHMVVQNRIAELTSQMMENLDRELRGDPIYADQLRPGDRFHELKDDKKSKPGKILGDIESCKTDANCFHVKTSRGSWCIARRQIILLVA